MKTMPLHPVAVCVGGGLTFRPGHTSHSRGRGPADRTDSWGAADTQPQASSEAETRTIGVSCRSQIIQVETMFPLKHGH